MDNTFPLDESQAQKTLNKDYGLIIIIINIYIINQEKKKDEHL